MTIEDAITSPTPVWVPPRVHTAWAPSWGYQGDGSVDDLSQQQGQQTTIAQSFDDGLPDTVTLTSGNDAVATLAMDLGGRGPFTATTVGWRTAQSGTQIGNASAVNAQFPADLETGDLVIVTFAVCPDVVGSPIFPDYDPERRTALLADFWDDDGLGTGGVRILIYSIVPPPGQAGFFFSIDWEDAADYRWAWSCSAVYARQGGFNVGIRPEPATAVTAGNTNTISGLTGTLRAPRGYVYTAWATRDTTLTATDTQISNVISADPALTDIRLMTQRTGVVVGGTYTRTVAKGATNNWGLGVMVPLAIDDRPAMDPRQYFSPFNELSPVVAYERDVAPVTWDFGVLTSTGPDYARLFTGQMSDVPVKSRSAALAAISATRIKMMRAVKPPLVWGAREGCNMSWVLSWIWYQCGLAVAPLPSNLTKLWMPLHGSIHPHWGEPVTINAYQHDALGFNQAITPSWVKDAPYLMGTFGERTTTRTVENVITWEPLYSEPTYNRDYGGTLRDLLSRNGGVGRFSAWVRGDTAMGSTSPYVNPSSLLLNGNVYLQDTSPVITRASVQFGIRASDRNLFMRVQDNSGNDTTWVTNQTLPSDGAWHYVSFSWDWMAGTAKVRMDAGSDVRSPVFVTDDNDLPIDERAYVAGTDSSGFGPGKIRCDVAWTLPMSDVYVDSGTSAYGDPEVGDEAFTSDVITRPLDVALEALIEPVAREAWQIMVDIAQASLSWYRTDEQDRVNFLPLGYFGEDAQMTPQDVVIDTETNAEDPDVVRDPTRIRNRVTVEFNETRVDDILSPVLQWTTSTIIPPGTTQIEFPLDTTMMEPLISSALTNLNDTQVTNGTIPPGVSYMTINSLADGTGTYFTSAQVSGRVVSFASDSVTIEFKNTTGVRRYLANDGQEVPFLGVLGFAVRSSTGYSTTSDDTSIARRGERALSAQIEYLQRRSDAMMISGWLTAMLCDPVSTVTVKVFGDPTRQPGQLVRMQDRQGTSLGGTWRITAITHNRDGAQYTQDLSLVQWGSVAEWDESTWDDGSVWGE